MVGRLVSARRQRPRDMMPPVIPIATYRLQLHRDFTFKHASELVPYLRELGISHCYVSPYLKARPGSRHGYDIVDHSTINPEIGSNADYEEFVSTLATHGMGQILDIVPNHMGVGGSDNPWWLDVLENGPASIYADYFDIDWNLAKHKLDGKLIVPLLEDYYGTVLEKGLLKLEFEPARGEFFIQYHDHRFPVDPQTYPAILHRHLDALDQPVQASVRGLLNDFDKLPPTWENMPQRRVERQRLKEAAKARLAVLCQEQPALLPFIQRAIGVHHGQEGIGPSFDALHDLLERQPYRLAYWRVAADEINYRRFFDINTLAALREERLDVFEATHWLVLELVGKGKVHGLRLDHPDGLYDPAQYYAQLQRVLAERVHASALPAVYTVTEKILGTGEQLPSDWNVHGTTGYDFSALVDGMLIQPAGRAPLTQSYERFVGRSMNFNDLLYDNKKLIMRTLLSAELMVLANKLDRLSETNRHTRDFTLHTLREAIMEFIACLPVYRTYITAAGMSDQDRLYLDVAYKQARRRNRALDPSVFDFLRSVMHLKAFDEKSALHAHGADFVMRLQQYSAPVMAKGLEDTTFYTYNRLISLNEVGGDPRRFGITLDAFHRVNRERLQHWPHSMLSSSTHDSKRSEDMRARLHVISELAQEWGERVERWSTLNLRHRRDSEDEPRPSRNDEYLIYQTLLGAWPLASMDADAMKQFGERIETNLLKAAREAKVNTSWIQRNEEYETALIDFVRALLAPGENAFLNDFLPFQQRIARYGLLNSLSATLIKLTAPGVPDIYQGNELWDFSMVDPDNRRPVDYAVRQRLLTSLGKEPQTQHLAQWLDTLEDGRAKLYLIRRTLWLRRRWPDIFLSGNYAALVAQGAQAESICGYARTDANAALIVAVPRWVTRLGDGAPPLGEAVWSDTWLETAGTHDRYTNALTGETLVPTAREGRPGLNAADLFRHFPVAVLVAGRNVL
jgi:(1->4)-alpha-D-glucan 1-alpha-D-glucosylmutase